MVNQGMEILAAIQKRVTLQEHYLQSHLFRVMIQVFLQYSTVEGFQKKKTQMSTSVMVCHTQAEAVYLNSNVWKGEKLSCSLKTLRIQSDL